MSTGLSSIRSIIISRIQRPFFGGSTRAHPHKISWLNPIKSPIKSPKLSPFLLGDVPQSSHMCHMFPFVFSYFDCSLFSQMISHLPAPNTFTRKYSGASATAQHRSTRRIPTPRCHGEGPKFRVSFFDLPIFDVDQWGMMFEYVWIIFWVSYFLIFDVDSICWIWLNVLPLKSFEVDSNHPPKEDGKKGSIDGFESYWNVEPAGSRSGSALASPKKWLLDFTPIVLPVLQPFALKSLKHDGIYRIMSKWLGSAPRAKDLQIPLAQWSLNH